MLGVVQGLPGDTAQGMCIDAPVAKVGW